MTRHPQPDATADRSGSARWTAAPLRAWRSRSVAGRLPQTPGPAAPPGPGQPRRRDLGPARHLGPHPAQTAPVPARGPRRALPRNRPRIRSTASTPRQAEVSNHHRHRCPSAEVLGAPDTNNSSASLRSELSMRLASEGADVTTIGRILRYRESGHVHCRL